MSRLVNLSDDVYGELTRIKRAKNASYSEVVEGLLKNKDRGEKTMDLKALGEWCLKRSKAYKGKLDKTDHDQILYGGSDAGR